MKPIEHTLSRADAPGASAREAIYPGSSEPSDEAKSRRRGTLVARLGRAGTDYRIHWLLGAACVSLLAGCGTLDIVKTQSGRIDSLESQLTELHGQRVKLVEDQARERESAMKTAYDADMKRAENTANYVFAAKQANAHNPQQNRDTKLVAHYADVALAASPRPPEAQFQAKLDAELPQLEDPKLTDEQLVKRLHEDFTQVVKDNLDSTVKHNQLDTLAQTQKQQLVELDNKIGEKEKQVVTAHRKMTEATLRELEKEKDSAALYAQLIWLFGACAAVAGIGAGVCAYLQHPRMAIYAALAAASFVGCCFLTIWLRENRWVLWVVFGGGMICAAGTFILRYGWNVRDTQLRLVAASRDRLQHLLTLKGKTLEDFGLGSGTDLNVLDVHELEELCEKLAKLPDVLVRAVAPPAAIASRPTGTVISAPTATTAPMTDGIVAPVPITPIVATPPPAVVVAAQADAGKTNGEAVISGR